jgi:integrase
MMETTLTLSSSQNKIPPKSNEREEIDMRGGWYFYRGRPRVWVPWKGKKLFFTKYLDGSRIYSPEQAERLLERIRSEVDQKSFDPANWGKDRTIIFQNAWEIYMKQVVCGKVRTGDRERVYEINLLPYWKDRSLSEIEEHHIKDWFAKLPSHYQPASLLKIRNVFKGFLNHFSVTRRKAFAWPKVQIPKKAVLWLSQDDQEKVFEFIPIQHQGILRFIKTYGCRSSEACNLKKTDIDWEKRIIVFRERKVPVENELPILDELTLQRIAGVRIHISTRVPAHPPIFNLHYVFCTSRGQPYTHQFLYNIWHAANVKAHQKYGVIILPLKNATRHSLASRLLEQGETLEVIARILGNSQQVVERSYGRIRTQKVMGILEGR